MHFCSKFGNCNFNWWWVIAWTSSKWGKFWLRNSIWPWRSRSIVPQNNRDLNQGLLHLWSKFGDPSWNGWWVIARTSLWLMHGWTHTQTDAGNNNTRRPKLASGQKSWQTDNGQRDDGGWQAVCHWISFTDFISSTAKNSKKKNQNSNSAGFWAILLSTLKPNIRKIA